MTYEPTIGLEIHAELCTTTKMFCNSKNDSDEKIPNVNICPVCMAHPGVLPTINKEAIRQVLRVGLSVNGNLADYSEFDRKNYFYPDIPKAYQLSQYEFPLVSGGSLLGVGLTRIHLEEDTARSSHTSDTTQSFVDFNRAGVPLMELVTEPEIHSAKQAGAFARELQLLLRTLGASHAHMEKGEMRVEVNISLARNKDELGTKVEVKNLNSFRAVERAIAFEIDRQSKLLDAGEKVVQETRGWDENKNGTFSQRLKEEEADYRYFPDPDLPKLKLSEEDEFSVEVLSQTIPELPWDRRDRLTATLGLRADDAEMYVIDDKLHQLLMSTIEHLEPSDYTLASNYISNNLVAVSVPAGSHVSDNVNSKELATVIELASTGDISSNGAVELIAYVAHGGIHVLQEAEKRGLIQQNDDAALKQLVDTILSENSDVAAEFKSGKEQALQFLVGQGMRVSNGSANPEKVKEMLRKELS